VRVELHAERAQPGFGELSGQTRGLCLALAGLGELALGVVFLVVLAFLAGPETREQLAAREAYRRAAPGS